MQYYKEFVEDAIRNYNSLDYEHIDLYKKYSVSIPTDIGMKGTQDISAEDEVNDFVEKLGVRFDAIISDAFCRSGSESVRILKAEEVGKDIIEGKIFKSSEDKLAAFINATASRFVVIDAKSGEKSLNILVYTKSTMPVQFIVNVGEGAKLELFEFHASKAESQIVSPTLHEIVLGKEARAEIDIVHDEDERTSAIGMLKSVAAERSRLKVNFVYNGGAATKARSLMLADGLSSEITVNEIAFGNKEQKFDLYNYMINSKPYTTALLESGAVLDGSAQCMLKGYAKVANGTKAANSRITERGILLSPDAHIDALPDMSIDYSDEVKATHSAATAPIDSEAIFYLTSRGISEESARKLFITAFIAKYLSNMDNGIAKEVAMSLMLNKLENGTFGNAHEISAKGIWAVPGKKRR
ncbi:MAG: SufD family Fe-S cluster assembly protein [Candidatus Micrarchaeota archaeon]|nr:SufD family Fe-S cluster assembly protein [Candidatus Micrarchaeota archaeon]